MMRKSLSKVLTAFFLLAIFMGSGLGLRIVNPTPNNPDASFTTLGLPTIYLWGLAWYFILLSVIVIAYFNVWVPKENED